MREVSIPEAMLLDCYQPRLVELSWLMPEREPLPLAWLMAALDVALGVGGVACLRRYTGPGK